MTQRLITWVSTGALVLVFAVSGRAQQGSAGDSDQQIIIKLEQGWNDAVLRKDTAFIDRLLADEFVATYDDGSRGDRKRELSLIAEATQQADSAVQDEFVVKVYRDAAVVWFTLKLAGTRDGQHAEVTLHYTDVWVMRDGRWQCVSSQNTRFDG